MPQRIRAGCDVPHLTAYRGCRSLPQRIRAGCDCTAPHSLSRLSIFATAHSRGLRLYCTSQPIAVVDLCHSAFARVATAENQGRLDSYELCHSAFARVATGSAPRATLTREPLPQRIRAGCDVGGIAVVGGVTLCHSAFARVATRTFPQGAIAYGLCHSAFARVATWTLSATLYKPRLCHSAFARVATAEKQCSALRICCEKVDSFSSVGESGLALTIFPFSFAAKATYVAINDSFGRAIDRFFGANRTGISVSYDFAEHPCL